MVNVAQAVSSGASGAAQYARASAASAALATGPVEAAPAVDSAANLPADQTVAATERPYRYNSFEFSYRQDFGKIVLLRQKPDTGEVVQQFPSEYYLRKYADSQRVAQSAAGGRDEAGTGPRTAVAAGVASKVGQAAAQAPSVSPQPTAPTVSAPTPAPAAPSAPALPGGSGTTSTGSVNLTV